MRVKTEKAQLLAQLLGQELTSAATPKVPSVRMLAERFHVSPVTILKALRILLAKGMIAPPTSLHRSYRVARAGSPDLPGKGMARGIRHEEIRNQLLRDFVYNAARGGYLPQKKVLRRRYGCSESALTKCIESLRKEGLVQVDGRRYRISVPQAPDCQAHYMYVCGAPVFVRNPRAHHLHFLGAIENLLSEMNWPALRFLLCHEAPNKLDSFLRAGSAMHASAGMIFLGAAEHERDWEPFFMKLGSVPLVFTDIAERRLWFLRQRENCLRIVPDNRYAGNLVGLYLRKAGHRKIALFRHTSMIPKKRGWFEIRTEGVLEGYPLGNGTSIFDIHPAPQTPKTGDHPTSSALESLSRLRKIAVDEWLNPELVVDAMTTLYKLKSLQQMTSDAIPSFESAYADRSITAWVCLNDDLAVGAHQFLLRKGNGRHRIGIIGFDNTLLAQKMGISSFDFAFEEMGRLAVRFISAPASILNNKAHSGELPVRGRLLVRTPVDE